MTGRLLGDVSLPPIIPIDWELKPGTIYGCPLCHIVNNDDDTELWEIIDDDLTSIDYYVNPLNYHGPSVSPGIIERLMPDTTVSIGVSMGHLYLKATSIDSSRLTNQLDGQITILDEDLPIDRLVYHMGSFYNLGANVVVNFTADQQLGTLATMHHRMESVRDNMELYTQVRVSFITALDNYLLPDGVSLDTEYGLKTLAMITSKVANNNREIPLTPVDIQGAFGTVYKGKLKKDTLVYKYLKYNDDFMIEKFNNQYINDNLDHHPNLPYPYTFDSYACGHIGNIHRLNHPTCQLSESPEYGMMVMDYIDNFGTVRELIKTLGIPLYIETIATLAEAHQGNTVKHHFMHLDAHGGNFLVSRCSAEDRICDLRHWRVVDFDGLNYKFGTRGYRVYMVDFGFSHFLDSERDDHKGDVPASVPLNDTLYPAYDLIGFNRSVLPELVMSVLKRLVGGTTDGTAEWNNVIRILKISACVLITQIMTLAATSMSVRQPTTTTDDVDVMNLDSLVEYISGLDDLSVASVQEIFIIIIDELANKLIELPADQLNNPLYYDLIRLFSGGLSVFRGAEELVIDFSDRTYYQQNIEPLDESILKQLNISEPPTDITGLALYLWYLQQ